MTQSSITALTKQAVTPLIVTLSFIALVEITVTIGLGLTDGVNEFIPIIFIVIFPVFISASFFILLYFRPSIFYGPQEFANVELMKAFYELNSNKMSASESIEKIKIDIYKDIESKIGAKFGKGLVENSKTRIDDAVKLIVSESFAENEIHVEIESGGKIVLESIYIYDKMDFQSLLDEVYHAIKKHRKILPFTYEQKWILYDKSDNKSYFKTNRHSSLKVGPTFDSRSIDEIGIRKGMTLAVEFFD